MALGQKVKPEEHPSVHKQKHSNDWIKKRTVPDQSDKMKSKSKVSMETVCGLSWTLFNNDLPLLFS